jgi:hypothetical protein
MLLNSIILFGIAAVSGVILAFRNERPMILSVVHGLVAATGLVFLVLAVLNGQGGILSISALVLLVVVALGGFILFSFHLRGKLLPKGLIYTHGLLAVVAEVLLVIAIV